MSIFNSIAFLSIMAVGSLLSAGGSGAERRDGDAGVGEDQERALADLLVSLFDDRALRRWARYRLGRGVYHALPPGGVSIEELAFTTVIAIRQHGVPVPVVFRSLSAERPGRSRDIWRVATLWAARWR